MKTRKPVEAVVLDSFMEIPPNGVATVCWMAMYPCKMTSIKPNPDA